MQLMTGRSHRDDDATGLLLGASSVAAIGIKPSGDAPVISAWNITLSEKSRQADMVVTICQQPSASGGGGTPV